jgi:hypothetical protein
MQPNDCQLRAIIASRDGGMEAQLLEIDIAARGADLDSLLREIGHAITVSYEVSLDLGEAPFSNLMSAPMQFQSQWNDLNHSAKKIGYVSLPEDVGMALASAVPMSIEGVDTVNAAGWGISGLLLAR